MRSKDIVALPTYEDAPLVQIDLCTWKMEFRILDGPIPEATQYGIVNLRCVSDGLRTTKANWDDEWQTREHFRFEAEIDLYLNAHYLTQELFMIRSTLHCHDSGYGTAKVEADIRDSIKTSLTLWHTVNNAHFSERRDRNTEAYYKNKEYFKAKREAKAIQVLENSKR